MDTKTTPQVWIGCLAAYNEGHLHGEWVNATDENEMNEALKHVIETSPALLPDEWFIADYDGFGNLASQLGEDASFATVARIGRLIEKRGEVFIAFVNTCEPDLETVTEDDFDAAYRGDWDNKESYAQSLVDELGWGRVPAQLYGARWSAENPINVFDELAAYLDWESIARELFQNGNYRYVNGHVFEMEC